MLQSWRKSLAIFLMFVAIFLIIAIFSYHPEDPSLLHAIEHDSKNLMGWYGSYIADPLMQSLGYSCLSIAIFSILTSIRILQEKTIMNWIIRLSIVILEMPIIAMFLGFSDIQEINDSDYTIIRNGGFIGYYLASEIILKNYDKSFLLILIISIIPSHLYSFYVPMQWFKLYLQETISNIKYKISMLYRKKNFIKKKKSSSTSSIFTANRQNLSNSQSIFKNDTVNDTLNNGNIYDDQENEIMNSTNKVIKNTVSSASILSVGRLSNLSRELSFRKEEKNGSSLSMQNTLKSDNKDSVNIVISNSLSKSNSYNDTLENVASEKDDTVINNNKIPKQHSQKLTASSYVPQYNIAFNLPSFELLKIYEINTGLSSLSYGDLEENCNILMKVLHDFGIKGEIINFSPGPVVTLYELEPVAGTKSSRVIGLSDDIARSMCATSARISVVSGKNAIGIELPNAQREIVFLRELLESEQYKKTEAKLPLVLGKNISGNLVIADLSKMPHLLVAGTTGSGKSVAINTMILSLLYKHTPQQCRIMMIDPKMLELSVYDGIPHLLNPVVTEPRKAINALKWVVREMESRYRAMSVLGVRNIHGYNSIIEESLSKGFSLEKHIQTGFDTNTGKPIFESISIKEETFPYIVVIVDEMADLMLVAGKDIEGYIQRLAQMARAAGIHLIMATQRPSVDVITGVIKANFPTRISFQVTSKIDSRTILGEMGAEQLLGMGDMLYMMPGGKIERVHGPFVDDDEVESVVSYLKSQGKPQYIYDITEETTNNKETNNDSSEEE